MEDEKISDELKKLIKRPLLEEKCTIEKIIYNMQRLLILFDDNNYGEKINNIYIKTKQRFNQEIREYSRKINAKNKNIYILNKNFKNIFSLNYTNLFPFTYSSLCSNCLKKQNCLKRMYTNFGFNNSIDNKEGFNSYFLRYEKNIQNIYYLHSASHIIKDSNGIYPLQINNKNYEDLDYENTIILSGTSKHKKTMISEMPHTRAYYERFKNIEGNLLIFGCSLDSEDFHIIEALHENKKINNIVITIHKDSDILAEDGNIDEVSLTLKLSEILSKFRVNYEENENRIKKVEEEMIIEFRKKIKFLLTDDGISKKLLFEKLCQDFEIQKKL